MIAATSGLLESHIDLDLQVLVQLCGMMHFTPTRNPQGGEFFEDVTSQCWAGFLPPLMEFLDSCVEGKATVQVPSG